MATGAEMSYRPGIFLPSCYGTEKDPVVRVGIGDVPDAEVKGAEDLTKMGAVRTYHFDGAMLTAAP
jgi:hypothetical protein